MGDRGGGYRVGQILGLSCLLVALVLGWGGVGGFGVAGAAGSGFRVGWGMAGRGDMISVFRGVSAGVVGGAGHWVIILCGLDIFLMFLNFLRS